MPYVLREVIRLDVVANFKQKDLDRLAALDDAVVGAWRNFEGRSDLNWAVLLTEEADCADQTIYNRQKRFLEVFGIDISIPYEFYRGLLTLGPMSLATRQSREALAQALAKGDAEKTLELFVDSSENFDQQRRAVLGEIVNGKLGKIELSASQMPK